MSRISISVLILSVFSLQAFGAPNPSQPAGPCKQIAQACESVGFVKGAWKKGDGLWRDCVNPIIQGQTTVQGSTKPLPQVDPGIVSACKANHPKFGSGKVGS